MNLLLQEYIRTWCIARAVHHKWPLKKNIWL